MQRAALAIFALALGLASSGAQGEAAPKARDIALQDAYEIAREAYIYAYPMVLMDATRAQLTNFADSGRAGFGPPNRFNNARAFPPADFRAVVRPNVDTLYSSAWLDLGPEPVVLSVPATDRYFMLPMLSMWTDVFAAPGTRTTGPDSAREFVVAGPKWSGAVPPGLELIRSPTRWVWIIGRTQTNGAGDYANVHSIQDRYRLTPLSAWGKADYAPPPGKVDPAIDMRTPPPAQVARMDAAAFFARFAEVLKDNPPNPADYPTLHRLQRVGLVAGNDFDLGSAPPAVRQAFERGTADAKKELAEAARKSSGEAASGWSYRVTGGAYGVDYRFRAAIAYSALGYNLPQDAVYPSLARDSEGRPLDGNERYVLHFGKGELPPVRAFWSVTAYDADGYFIPNALARQALGDRDKLVVNADGSLDLHLQSESPGKDKEANWLPVAKAPFNLLLRLYWPKSEVLDGAWTPPPVRRIP